MSYLETSDSDVNLPLITNNQLNYKTLSEVDLPLITHIRLYQKFVAQQYCSFFPKKRI